MFKRVIALLLCVVFCIPMLASCAGSNVNEEEEIYGPYIKMYLTDEVYDFDPAKAYKNESALRVVSLLFDNLFVLDKNGKVQKSLAKDYKIYENDANEEYKMTITLNTTYWNDSTLLSAEDVVFTWKRILDVEASYEAAALLFDIKNARAIKSGDASIDDLGVFAVNSSTVDITFEGKIDYNQFLLNLTSYALVPLREAIVSRTDDWAKKPGTIACSGPFVLRKVSYEDENRGLILERNAYYYRDRAKDVLDKYITPYQLVIDYTQSPEQIRDAYNNGEIFYIGDIPLSIRNDLKDKATITDALSTHSYYFNTSVEPFNNANVRKALSLAIDRDAIAAEVVFAKPATGLVPDGVFEADSKKQQFRSVGGDLIATTANMSEARSLLSQAGINPSEYSFAITVAAYDDVHMAIARRVRDAWAELGFNVSIRAIDAIVNDDIGTTGEVDKTIRDDIFEETFVAGDWDVVAIDYIAFSVDPFSLLAPFAKQFSGQAMDMDIDIDNETYEITPHITKFDDENYNAIIQSAFDEKNSGKSAQILHDAEKALLDQMPVMPIVFNQYATLTSGELSKISYSYYNLPIFNKTMLKDFMKYYPTIE